MTSATRALQCGQRGSGTSPPGGEVVSDRDAGLGAWGCLFRGGRRIFLLLETTQHAERVRIDRAWAGAAADVVPALPIAGDGRRFHLEPLFEARTQLGRAQAQLAFAMQLGGLTVRWPEPLDRLAPREIGRASCRERAWISVRGGALNRR